METRDGEDQLLHSVALQNAASILRARQRAEEELLAAKDALHQTNQRITNILESITDGFIALDFEWRFIYMNPRGGEILQSLRPSPADFVGKSFWEEFPALEGSEAEGHCRRAMEERVPVEFELYYSPLRRWFEVRGYPSREGLSIYLHDVTRRKDAEATLSAEKKVLELIAAGAPLAQVLDRLAREAEALSTDGMLCSVLFLDAERKHLLHGAAPSLPEAYNRSIHGVAIGPRVGSCGTAAFEGRRILVDDIEHDPLWEDFSELALGHGLKACCSTPVLSGAGEVLGTIAMYFREPRAPSARDDRLIGIATRLAGIAMERDRAADALRRSEFFSRSIVESSRDCIKTLDLDGTLLWMSEAGREGLCITELAQVIGKSWFDFWDGKEREAAVAAVGAAIRGETGKFVGCFRVNGEERWWNVAITPIADASGKPETLLAISRDITDRINAEHQVRESEAQLRSLTVSLQEAAQERERLLESERAARTESERASRMKDEFLATLSHELRTPLSSILGWSRLLRGGGRGAADLEKGLDVIERNARTQTQLIEDLLDMSRIISGKVRLDIQRVEPASFIEAAVETVRPAADAKGVRLETVLDSAPCAVSGDPARLQQVVWNLLANAIKFTPRGGRVQVVLERVNSHVEICIADTGVGIDPRFIDHVFERFRQADASTTRRFGGLGLGLSIVRHLVELHGGTVQARSEGDGRGATFVVNLPVAIGVRANHEVRHHPTTPRPAPLEPHTTDLTGVKVLVVDDQADARELLARVLAECNAQVLTAGNANDALALIASERPNVLVSDIGMPDVDGYELLRRVRALDASRGGRTPAIALTAFARSEDRTRALRAGFVVHVSKPVEPTELIATVASVAGRAGH